MTESIIKVLIVEDSPVARELLVHIFGYDPKLQVIGTASSGEEALECVETLKPDVITMDLHLPKMNGFETTRKIMETNPIPIIVVTASSSVREVSLAMNALDAGALAVVQKPRGIGHPDYEAEASELIRTVKLMSQVKLVRRIVRLKQEKPILPKTEIKPKQHDGFKLVAIGTSTGGPPVIQTILSRLPTDLHVPILIVQHMSEGFIQGYVEWLNTTSSLPVHVALNGEIVLPGHVYVAPDSFQMKVKENGKIFLTIDHPEYGLCPSVSYLFRSVAEAFGENAIGVLLTGMGKDGAMELKLMKDMGAITIAQDKESSVVHGMPGEAISLGAAMYVLPPEKIASVLVGLVQNRSGRG
ncbi:MAG: chemotaxis-specific protein-glutamate methyltransferase CheB [Candidatus Methanoperedens sp.]